MRVGAWHPTATMTTSTAIERSITASPECLAVAAQAGGCLARIGTDSTETSRICNGGKLQSVSVPLLWDPCNPCEAAARWKPERLNPCEAAARGKPERHSPRK